MIATWPKVDQSVAMSLIESPVTQIDEVAVNSAVRNPTLWCPPALEIGNTSTTVEIATPARNRPATTRAGDESHRDRRYCGVVMRARRRRRLPGDPADSRVVT